MMSSQTKANVPVPDSITRLRRGIVLRVHEHQGEISIDGDRRWVRYARHFPAPRTERVSPGHLVAVARTPEGTEVVVWRWYDAVVIEERDDMVTPLGTGARRSVSDVPRPTAYVSTQPGTRVYLFLRVCPKPSGGSPGRCRLPRRTPTSN